MSKLNAEKAIEWYKETRPTYEQLTNKVENLIIELFKVNNIVYSEVTSRTKSIDSYYIKASKEKYTNPINQIKDSSGIRVIAYVTSDVSAICDIIKNNFEIDNVNSIDKSELLGVDKVGYRSIHYVAKFNKERLELPEYKVFHDKVFEIQVRTILQHAWAEIEHDRNYKFNGELPQHVKRDFYLIAGTLELVDQEFDTISKNIDIYAEEVKNNIDKGKTKDILIDNTSIREYMYNKFSKEIDEGLLTSNFGPQNSTDMIIKELNNFGITNLQELESLTPKDKNIYNIFFAYSHNFISLLRDFMIYKDTKKYFEKSWKGHWSGLSRADYNEYVRLGIEVDDIIKKYNFDIEDEY